jgi:hypothetical protein
MPRKVEPSELSAVSRQILSRISDPPVDLNDLWVVPASECEDLLREAYGKYGLETVPVPEVASSPPPRESYQWRQSLGLLFASLRSSVYRWLRLRNRSSDGRHDTS